MGVPTMLTCADAIGSRVVASTTWPVMVACCCSWALAILLASVPNDAVKETAQIRLRALMGTSWRETGDLVRAPPRAGTSPREDLPERHARGVRAGAG